LDGSMALMNGCTAKMDDQSGEVLYPSDEVASTAHLSDLF